MLKAIKAMLVGVKEIPVRPTARVATPQSPAGYFMPATAERLLDTASRKQCLQQLWENSALPKDLYTDFYLQPLKQLMTLLQVLPAAQQGEYAREGGLAEVTLQTVTYAVRLAKGICCPLGPHRKNRRPKMCSGTWWCSMRHCGTTCRCLANWRANSGAVSPGWLAWQYPKNLTAFGSLLPRQIRYWRQVRAR